MSELNAPTKRPKLLPENAYRKLEPGEEYKPIIPADDKRAEVTPWSIGLGTVMVVIFAAACVYIALRAGNGIEASIPIATLAIFFGVLRKTKSTILENVMVQSVGQASGVVAAGATFVIPAIYINQLEVEWWQIFIACTLGGILGTVMIIALRKYFVKDLHGELPFPEATAINEVLVTGESGAGGAGKVLLMAFLLGAVFDFLIEGAHLWNAGISTSALPGGVGEFFASLRIEIQIAGIAALFGLGYIIGIKYAAIIAAGSVLAFVVLVPAVHLFGRDAGTFAYAGDAYTPVLMGAGGIFAAFIKPIGIGAIAISGLIGIIRMGGIVASSVTLGFKGLKGGAQKSDDPRTQIDMNPKNVLLIQLVTVLAMGVFFFVVALTTGGDEYSTGECVGFAVVGMLAGFLLSFLFTPVAAQAIAIVGVNPVSGMTLITVVLAIGALILVGLRGTTGMIIALIVGTAVCTALSTSGALISDFKVGYWIGSTPRNQQRWKFLGIIVAALVVALVIPLMDEAYSFLIKDPTTGQLISNDKVLPAPQANMIAKVSEGLLSDPANQPWMLYGLGGVVSVLLYMAGVPMLAFALGMYLPIFINMAVLFGAICSWLISRTGKKKKIKKARAEQGILIASGMMAGAAIFGIITAVLRLPGIGAPIQYISVGEEFRLEAVVDGEVVRKEGIVVNSCDDVTLEEGEKCNELLKPVPYFIDDKGNVAYADETLQLLQDKLDAIQSGVDKLADGGDNEEIAEAKTAVREEALRLKGTLGELQQGKQIAELDSIVGAPKLVTNAAALRTQLKLQAAQTKTDEAIEDSSSSGAMFTLAEEVHHKLHPKYANEWFHGGVGQGLGLLMLVLLGFACFLLAKKGADWQLKDSKE